MTLAENKKQITDFQHFQEIVAKYAKAYSDFEDMQKQTSFVPEKGDQKTGIIGEAYVFKYLTEQKCAEVKFGNASQSAWDIQYKKDINDKEYTKVQVKTVSEFSDKLIISPIHPGFDILYLVKLNRSFFPEKILKVTPCKDWPNQEIKGKKYPDKDFSFKNYKFKTEDETEELIEVLRLKEQKARK